MIKGVMIESNIFQGNQKLNFPLKYGVSITDGCIDIYTSKCILNILNSNETKTLGTLDNVRQYLSLFENSIINEYDNNNLLLDNLKSTDIIINYDNEIFDICKINNLNSIIMCLLHKRLSTSELIANMKYNMNIYNFLLKNNDYYKLVTDRTVEKTILNRINIDSPINSPISNENMNNKVTELFIRIMELSKRIQVKYLEQFISNKKIGYIGNTATFSYELINKNFNGIHIGSNNINDLYNKLDNNNIDYAIIPTYNSLVGIVFNVDPKYTILGSIDYKIELCLFANNKLNPDILRLYVEPNVLKESKEYITKNLQNINIIICDTTEEGCIRCIQDENSMTIASKNNNCNFLKLVDSNIVEHNITTFSLIKI
jgi:chorismate mutase